MHRDPSIADTIECMVNVDVGKGDLEMIFKYDIRVQSGPTGLSGHLASASVCVPRGKGGC